MKPKIIFLSKILICWLFMLQHLAVQGQVEIGGNYSFITSVPSNHFVAPMGVQNNKSSTSHFDKPFIKGNIINVINIDDNLVYFKYWKFEPGSTGDAEYGDKVYYLSLDEFKALIEPVYKRYKGVTAGAYTVPIRLRGTVGGGDFDFEPSLSLQTNVVLSLGSRKKQTAWLDLALGIGLTGVELNKLNSTVPEPRSATALTVSTGIVFKFNPNINLGLFIGKDWLSAKDKAIDWEYDGKLWLGLGINVPFTIAKTTDNTANPGKQK